jgi:co-chaperonin GroES (HSP10)
MKVVSSTLGNRVLVKRSEAPEKIGSFIIPDTVKDGMKPLRGEVVLTSDMWISPEGVKVFPLLKRGDHVWYDGYKGTPVVIDDEEYLVLAEGDIFLVL